MKQEDFPHVLINRMGFSGQDLRGVTGFLVELIYLREITNPGGRLILGGLDSDRPGYLYVNIQGDHFRQLFESTRGQHSNEYTEVRDHRGMVTAVRYLGGGVPSLSYDELLEALPRPLTSIQYSEYVGLRLLAAAEVDPKRHSHAWRSNIQEIHRFEPFSGMARCTEWRKDLFTLMPKEPAGPVLQAWMGTPSPGKVRLRLLAHDMPIVVEEPAKPSRRRAIKRK